MDINVGTSCGGIGNIGCDGSVRSTVERKRARDAERKRERRKSDAKLRAREVARKRQRRQSDPEVRAREAERRRQRRAEDPELRVREAEAQRQRRARDIESARQREAEKQRKRRAANPEAFRQRDSAARALRRARKLQPPGIDGATAHFHDRHFGHSCSVCDRLGFDNNLSKGEPTLCDKCKNSRRNAQTATIPPLKGGVDVAVGTRRRADRKLCKSTQASLDPFMVDWWTDTADLEDLQDTGTHRRESTGECPAPPVHGSSGRHERVQSPGVSAVHRSHLDSQEGPASGRSDESLDSSSFASTGPVGAAYSERGAEVAVHQTILPANVAKPVTIELSANFLYMCAFCLTEFADLQDLAGHVEVCPWPEPYLCGLCSKPCEDWKTTRTHMGAHVGNKLKCPFCHRRHYKFKYDLVRHHIMLHVTVCQFMCGLCRSAFPTKKALQSHHSVSRSKGLPCRYIKHRPRKDNVSGPRPAASTRQGAFVQPRMVTAAMDEKAAQRQAELKARRAAAARQRRQTDPLWRARQAAAARRRRQANLEAVRAREAAAARLRRQQNPEAVRAREAAAKRRQRSKVNPKSKEGPASGRSDESLDSSSFASTGPVGAAYSERGAEVAVHQTILPANVAKPVTIELSANCLYMCAFCLTEFADLRDLAGHVEVCPWPEPYLCGLCSKPCEDWKTTKAHMGAHVGYKLKCPFCHRRNYKFKYDLVRHHIMLHVTVCQFMCQLAFPTKKALQSHHSVSRSKGLPCRYIKHRPRKGNVSGPRPAASTHQ
ncbi:uncharacterized protein LOC119164527 isoform X3 [Rhipicephalus microplus]|uniref:uncharacterized protein LOC119164527 isoform X3 n=1 Tax=Rhipicephalus microplus TaxID=6941 RepID=UPI003F6B2AAF